MKMTDNAQTQFETARRGAAEMVLARSGGKSPMLHEDDVNRILHNDFAAAYERGQQIEAAERVVFERRNRADAAERARAEKMRDEANTCTTCGDVHESAGIEGTGRLLDGRTLPKICTFCAAVANTLVLAQVANARRTKAVSAALARL